MEKERKKIQDVFLKNKNNLPLSLHNINVTEKKKVISGKIIEVTVFNTKLFPVDYYYKLVTRL